MVADFALALGGTVIKYSYELTFAVCLQSNQQQAITR